MSGNPRIAATPAAPPPMATEAISSSSLWSDGLLPPELAGLVLGRLPSLADRVRFGAVCRHWRLGAQQQAPTLPPALPWIGSFPRQVFKGFADGEVHDLGSSSQPVQSAVCCGSSDNWSLFESPAGSCVVGGPKNFLKNPLSGATIPLPDNFRSVYGFDFGSLFIRKFIVCSDGLIVAMTGRCIFSPPHAKDPLIACCRPGMFFWSSAATNPGYEDIAFHHGKVYGVAAMGDLYVHEISEDSDTGEPVVSYGKQVIKGSKTCFGHTTKQLFLVVSRGNLLLVKWNNNGPPAFEVLKADLEMSRWSAVSSLGDQVLFVSGRCSKAVSASSHGNYLCGNRIYLIYYKTDSTPNVYGRREVTIHGMLMYDLRDNMCRLRGQTLIRQFSSLAPAWFFPHQ